jgi:hypothetical protein
VSKDEGSIPDGKEPRSACCSGNRSRYPCILGTK